MRGISMYDSSSVSTLFSSLGSSKSTGSGLFGINLSEYASIRSGSYGKLMRSYFSMDSTKGTSKSDDSTKNTIETLYCFVDLVRIVAAPGILCKHLVVTAGIQCLGRVCQFLGIGLYRSQRLGTVF